MYVFDMDVIGLFDDLYFFVGNSWIYRFGGNDLFGDYDW